jgi:nitrate reductase beta subunit
MSPRWGSNWEDDLAGAPAHAAGDPDLAGLGERVRLAFEQVFMFYLPRICEHCLNPSCVASCPSGAMYKREEAGIVLVDQDRCRGWRFCVSGCPYKKVYFNHRTGKAEKCTLCFPRIEAGQPTICSETCVGRLRYLGLFLYDADKVLAAAATSDRRTCMRRSCRCSSTLPTQPSPARPRDRASPRTGSTRPGGPRCTRWRSGTR